MKHRQVVIIIYLYNATQPVATDWKTAYASLKVDVSIKEVSWATPGAKAGLAKLEEFCSKRLKQFATNRNDPTTDNLSGLSPWLHFGELIVEHQI